MKRRRNLFLHLSQLGALAKKFALVILFLASLLLMFLSRSHNVGLEQVNGVATGTVSVIVDVLVVPAKIVTKIYDYFSELRQIKKDNEILKKENKKLHLLENKYKALEIENKLLAKLLNYVPLPEVEYISAKVVAEESDAFAHSMVAYIKNKRATKGDAVLSDLGMVGRVDKINGAYAKIIAITDINSQIPVIIEGTRVRGILSGDNTILPKLIFTPLDAKINVGDRIVTSGVSGVFPAGLPIGQVISVSKSEIKVKPFVQLDNLEYVKIVKYKLDGLIKTSESEK